RGRGAQAVSGATWPGSANGGPLPGPRPVVGRIDGVGGWLGRPVGTAGPDLSKVPSCPLVAADVMSIDRIRGLACNKAANVNY
ncbi:hypothetical protein, partial [Micromonospora sp. KC723]|uniref:hypothetical protein n=1 Tax=Micromonospora sp. KC723 TaxID=2530381 RepID=UPI001A9FEEED